MAISDHDHVNFAQDYELDYVLTRVNKRKTANNRATLQAMGRELKIRLGKRIVTHKEFFEYVRSQLHRLE